MTEIQNSFKHLSERSSHENRLGKSKMTENAKPIRLSSYYQERSLSKNKSYIKNISSTFYKAASQSNQTVRDLQTNILKSINCLIQKLQIKKKNTLQSHSQMQLKDTEKLIIDCTNILNKHTFNMTSSCTSFQKQTVSETYSPILTNSVPENRIRVATFSLMDCPIKNYTSQQCKIKIPVHLHRRGNPEPLQLSLPKEIDLKTSASIQVSSVASKQQNSPIKKTPQRVPNLCLKLQDRKYQSSKYNK